MFPSRTNCIGRNASSAVMMMVVGGEDKVVFERNSERKSVFAIWGQPKLC